MDRVALQEPSGRLCGVADARPALAKVQHGLESRCKRPAADFAGGCPNARERVMKARTVALQTPSGRLCGCSRFSDQTEKKLVPDVEERTQLLVALQAPSGRLCG